MLGKKSNIALVACVMIIFMSITCKDVNSNQNSAPKKEGMTIDRSKFYKDSNRNAYVVKYSNVWINLNNQRIKIPIYNGVHGDVDLQDLGKSVGLNNTQSLSILFHLYFPNEKGNTKNSILECVKFYKNSLLSDIDIQKPSVIGIEGKGLIIWYDYNYHGITSSLMLGVQLGSKCNPCNFKNINEIDVDDNSKGFAMSIVLGEESGFKK